jgi:hypothetical protein
MSNKNWEKLLKIKNTLKKGTRTYRLNYEVPEVPEVTEDQPKKDAK